MLSWIVTDFNKIVQYAKYKLTLEFEKESLVSKDLDLKYLDETVSVSGYFVTFLTKEFGLNKKQGQYDKRMAFWYC